MVTNGAGVILAAGHGVRMKSRIPKVLHQVCGKELIRYPLELLRQLGVGTVVVVVSPDNGTRIREILGDAAEYATQPERSGTGDALTWALKQLNGRVEQLLVLNGDVPPADSGLGGPVVSAAFGEWGCTFPAYGPDCCWSGLGKGY